MTSVSSWVGSRVAPQASSDEQVVIVSYFEIASNRRPAKLVGLYLWLPRQDSKILATAVAPQTTGSTAAERATACSSRLRIGAVRGGHKGSGMFL
jgi:hypothetical protein